MLRRAICRHAIPGSCACSALGVVVGIAVTVIARRRPYISPPQSSGWSLTCSIIRFLSQYATTTAWLRPLNSHFILSVHITLILCTPYISLHCPAAFEMRGGMRDLFAPARAARKVFRLTTENSGFTGQSVSQKSGLPSSHIPILLL